MLVFLFKEKDIIVEGIKLLYDNDLYNNYGISYIVKVTRNKKYLT